MQLFFFINSLHSHKEKIRRNFKVLKKERMLVAVQLKEWEICVFVTYGSYICRSSLLFKTDYLLGKVLIAARRS